MQVYIEAKMDYHPHTSRMFNEDLFDRAVSLGHNTAKSYFQTLSVDRAIEMIYELPLNMTLLKRPEEIPKVSLMLETAPHDKIADYLPALIDRGFLLTACMNSIFRQDGCKRVRVTSSGPEYGEKKEIWIDAGQHYEAVKQHLRKLNAEFRGVDGIEQTVKEKLESHSYKMCDSCSERNMSKARSLGASGLAGLLK